MPKHICIRDLDIPYIFYVLWHNPRSNSIPFPPSGWWTTHTLTGDVVRDNDMLELWWLDVDITISSNNQLNRLQLQWIISTLPFTLLMIAKWVFQPLQVLVMVRAIHSAIWANKFSLVASLLSACHSRKQDISIFYWDLKKCITLFKSLVEDNVKEDYADLRKTPQCEIQK